jgi:hypothetical protein
MASRLNLLKYCHGAERFTIARTCKPGTYLSAVGHAAQKTEWVCHPAWGNTKHVVLQQDWAVAIARRTVGCVLSLNTTYTLEMREQELRKAIATST